MPTSDRPPVDAAVLEELAKLARLDIGPEEASRLVEDIGRILTWVDRLGEFEPAEGDGPLPTRLREDEIRPSLGEAAATANAPGAEPPLFKVPPAFGGEG